MAKARIARINKLAAYYAAYGAYCTASNMTQQQLAATHSILERAADSQVSLSFQRLNMPQAAFMPGFMVHAKSMDFETFYKTQVLPEFQLELDGIMLKD